MKGSVYLRSVLRQLQKIACGKLVLLVDAYFTFLKILISPFLLLHSSSILK